MIVRSATVCIHYTVYRVGKTYIKYIVGGSGEGVDGDITAKGHYDD